MIPWLSTLRARSVLLVLLAVLPALGLLLYTASEQRELAVAETLDDARQLARLAAADQGRLIEGTRQLLVVLAQLPEVHAAGAAACSALLADVLAQHPLYANLGVVAPDGNLSCSAVPTGGPLNLGDRDYFQRALQTRDFAVGEYQIGRVTGKATLNAGYPVIDEAGGVVGVVYAALDLAWLSEFVAQAPLPPESALTVIDRRGTVLARYPDPARWVGRSLAGTPVVETILAQGAGVAEASDADGGVHLYAFAPLGGTPPTAGAYLSIAIPMDGAVAPADRVFRRNLAWLGLVGVLALTAAWVGGNVFIHQDAEAQKALVRRTYDALNAGTVDSLDELVATDFVDHDPVPGQAPGLAGFKQAVALFRAAFPDGQVAVEEVIAEGDKVVARVTLRGTQAGEFLGAPPTGAPVTAEGVEIFRLARGKVVEGWSRFGALVPAPAEEGQPHAGEQEAGPGAGAARAEPT